MCNRFYLDFRAKMIENSTQGAMIMVRETGREWLYGKFPRASSPYLMKAAPEHKHMQNHQMISPSSEDDVQDG